ncbi:hypothetical protein D3218_18020 [Aureimonas flava]|uniref:Endonuclease/exonuclease/phosphatase domain-containing protein n=1 Tax=Aureimonas flava TaxID=2320271 RepID=A0A3A1WEW8_9HYPH|nr:endonuclease/exonuclease/phosphatase family protein [Aureimonas flava]RIX97980.1 hypothetical protein D3218_18020 [Aureimonas flava]
MSASTLRRLAWLAIATLAVLAFAATFLPLLPTDAWWVRYLDYPRLQITAAMLVLLAACLLVPGRRRTRAPVALLLALALGRNAVLLAPYLLPPLAGWPAPAVAQARDCPADRRLRILSVNVQMGNHHDHRLIEMVRRVDPDVAWFQETDAWWERELAPLSAALPHGLSEAQPNYYGIHLFSRLPLENGEVRNLTNSRNPSAFATAVLPSGDRVRLYAIHPRPPQVGQSTAERDAQMMAMALEAHGDTLPYVAMGDMNTVPWERIADRMKRIGGFADPRVGRGLLVTWNANSALLKWPLDHVMPGPDWTLSRLEVLPRFGSDHHPLLAELCLRPAGGARSRASAAELEEARRTVRRGQGRAVDRDASQPPGTSDANEGGTARED